MRRTANAGIVHLFALWRYSLAAAAFVELPDVTSFVPEDVDVSSREGAGDVVVAGRARH